MIPSLSTELALGALASVIATVVVAAKLKMLAVYGLPAQIEVGYPFAGR
jgi:hypothetical protein